MYKNNFKFRWNFRNFEIRTVHQDYKNENSPLRNNCPIELVRYFNDSHTSCYTVAHFCYGNNGYELHFVGNRPLEDITPTEIKSIWVQLQAAQKMLDAYYEASQ